MARIFLINVGANSDHYRNARSPVFEDGTFVYTPFPLDDAVGHWPYPENAWPFTNGLEWHQTHCDPDWPQLTYGDNTHNPRARALGGVEPGDTLLFWSMLCSNSGTCWHDFTGEKGWYLIGSLYVDEILCGGMSHRDAKPENQTRASYNAHFVTEKLPEKDLVFIGTKAHSLLYEYAVPFVTGGFGESSLLYQAVRMSNGDRISLDNPRWVIPVRSCRAICDLSLDDDLERATLLRDAIKAKNEGFDLLGNT